MAVGRCPAASSAAVSPARPGPGDDDDLVGQPLGLGQLVGGEDHADPTAREVGDDRPDGQPALGVDAGRRLVQEDHLGPAHQGQGQRQPLLLAARQPPPRRLGHRSQPDPVEEASGSSGSS